MYFKHEMEKKKQETVQMSEEKSTRDMCCGLVKPPKRRILSYQDMGCERQISGQISI